MTSAATLAVPATDPHRASWALDVARWCKKAPSPARTTTTILTTSTAFQAVALSGPGERRDVPEAGHDEDRVGGPGHAGEGAGQRLGASPPRLRAGTDEAHHDDLATHPHGGRQDVEREADGVEARASTARALLALPVGRALLGEGDRAPPWRRPRRTRRRRPRGLIFQPSASGSSAA